MKNLHAILVLATALAVVALIARSGSLARKNSGESMRTPMTGEAPQLSAEDAQFIAETYPSAHTTSTGLRYIVLAPGDGPVAKSGQRVTTHYTGMFLKGQTFDSSRARNEPFVLTLGTDRVIQGWVEVLASMKKGERRLVIIPWWLAYGERGKGETIPPKATLVFDMEILDIN